MHEFKSPGGSAERGRGVLESVLRNYPKRIDLWSLYIDQVRTDRLSSCGLINLNPSIL